MAHPKVSVSQWIVSKSRIASLVKALSRSPSQSDQERRFSLLASFLKQVFHRLPSGVQHIFPFVVADGRSFELEGRVLNGDLEVFANATLHGFEHLDGVPVAETLVP